MDADSELNRISDFHGHLGPFVVIGYRMGKVANRLLGEDPFGKSAVVMTGGKTPMSCVVDGVQLASGCTLGKGNIGIVDHGLVSSLFISKSKKKSVSLELREEILSRIMESEKDQLEQLATELFHMPEESLLKISED